MDFGGGKRKVTFCTGCFATNEDGSWGPNGVGLERAEKGDDGYCINCGGHGHVLIVSRDQADHIRKNASWVGKRYYPHDEDFWNELWVRIPLLRRFRQVFGSRKRLYSDNLWIRFRVNNTSLAGGKRFKFWRAKKNG